jgi:hypothetical protein
VPESSVMLYNTRIAAISNLDAKLTASVFSSIIAVVLALIYYLSRIGFSNHLLPIVYVLSISLLLLNFPIFYRIIFHKITFYSKDTWITSDAFYSFIILSLLILIGFLVPSININIILIIFPIGLIAFFFIFIVWLSSKKIRQSLIFVGFTGLFSLWVAAIVWNSGYLTPLFFEHIIAFGEAHADTLFHAAIAGMIKTYGFPSTGINGLEYISYHYGSHWIFAQLAKLVRLDTVHFYNLAYPIIFVPFFYQVSILFIIKIKDFIHKANSSWILTTDYIFWLVFFIMQIGFITPQSELITSWGWNAHLISESYNISLSFTLILITMVLYLIPSIEINESYFINELFIIVFVPLLLIVIGFNKISLIYLLISFYIYIIYRLNLYRQFIYIVSIGLAISSILFVMYFIGKRSAGITFSPFDFFISYGRGNIFFFLFYFFFSWVFIILKCYEKNISSISDFKSYLITNNIMDIEIVLLFCLVGAAPGLIVGLGGSAAHYFADFQALIAVSLLLANLDNFYYKLARNIEFGPLGELKLKYFFIIIIGAFILISTAINYVKPISNMVSINLITRIQLSMIQNNSAVINNSTSRKSQGLIKQALKIGNLSAINLIIFRNVKGKIKQGLKIGNFTAIKDLLISDPFKAQQDNQEALLINKLQELGNAPPSERKMTVLFIPQSNKLYWNLLSCDRMPSLAPAISNLAMIDGLPEINCMGGYFMDYRRQEEQAPVDQIKDEICLKAWDQGFSRIILLDADPEANILVEPWHKGQK